MVKHITLSAPLFKIADGTFQKAESQEPVYRVKLGEVDATLPLKSILREFQIAGDSEDGKTLALVARALDFVSVLKVGDGLPSEVLTGKPSWDITDEHRLRAHHRLTLQLASWVGGEERVITNAEDLIKIADDPAHKKKWNEALDEAARRLGFAENGREQVLALVAQLADELAYIEALRDHVGRVSDANRKAQYLRKLYGRENSVREAANSVVRLVTIAERKFLTNLEEIDAQTGEILSVLRNPTRQVEYIKVARDDLYCRLFAWRDLLERWRKTPLARHESHMPLLQDTYHFLALRYMPAVEWMLMSQLQQGGAPRHKTAVVW